MVTFNQAFTYLSFVTVALAGTEPAPPKAFIVNFHRSGDSDMVTKARKRKMIGLFATDEWKQTGYDKLESPTSHYAWVKSLNRKEGNFKAASTLLTNRGYERNDAQFAWLNPPAVFVPKQQR